MKIKNLLLILVLVLSLVLTACSGKDNKDTGKDLVDEQVESGNQTDGVSDKENSSSNRISKMPSFTLKDIDGNEISSDIFGDDDMTIISIWQSTWGPCIIELDALKVIYDEYKDQGVNVLGIVVDDVETYGDEGVRDVIETLGLEFPNIVADYDYMLELINFVRATPTAIVVDKNGEFILPPMVGSDGKEGDIERFKSIIEEFKK